MPRPWFDEAAVRRRLLDEHGVEIGGGLGALKGGAWRIGLMGEGASTAAVDAVIHGLAAVLDRRGD